MIGATVVMGVGILISEKIRRADKKKRMSNAEKESKDQEEEWKRKQHGINAALQMQLNAISAKGLNEFVAEVEKAATVEDARKAEANGRKSWERLMAKYC